MKTTLVFLLLASMIAGVFSPAYAQSDQESLEYYRAFPLADYGYRLIKENRFHDALPYFERAVEIMPHNTAYRQQWVILLQKTGQDKKARRILAEGLAYSPGNTTLLALKQQAMPKIGKAPIKQVGIAPPMQVKDISTQPEVKSTFKSSLKKPILKPQREAPIQLSTRKPSQPPLDKQAVKLPPNALELAYTAKNQQNPELAIRYFSVAARDSDPFIAAQANKELGFLYSAAGDSMSAITAWKSAFAHAPDHAVALYLTQELRRINRPDEALEYFAAIPVSDLPLPQQAFYYTEGALLADALGRKEQALAYGEKAVQIRAVPEDYYYQAVRLQKYGQMHQAVGYLEKAHELDKKNRLYAITLAYAYRGEKITTPALPLFAYALEDRQYETSREDYAYALKIKGHREEAAQQFRQVLARQETPHEQYTLRREIQQLEDNWQSAATITYRDGLARAAGAPGVQVFDDTLQNGFETVYSPDSWQQNNRRMQLYGQAFVSSDSGSFNWDPDSAQGVFGIRGTPLENVEWYLYAARLVGIGENALDDWQLRTTYAFTRGFDFNPAQESWNHLFLTPDISYLVGRDELFATVEGRAGQSYRRGERWVLTPHVVGAAAYQNTRNNTQNVMEAGIGVSAKYWFAETAERAPRGSAEFILQWREPIAGNSEDKGGPYLRFVLQY